MNVSVQQSTVRSHSSIKIEASTANLAVNQKIMAAARLLQTPGEKQIQIQHFQCGERF